MYIVLRDPDIGSLGYRHLIQPLEAEHLLHEVLEDPRKMDGVEPVMEDSSGTVSENLSGCM